MKILNKIIDTFTTSAGVEPICRLFELTVVCALRHNARKISIGNPLDKDNLNSKVLHDEFFREDKDQKIGKGRTPLS